MAKEMRLMDWAKAAGYHPGTVRRWAREGKMPIETYKTKTGQWIVIVDGEFGNEEQSESIGKTVIYARVSSHDQKQDLDSQVGRILSEYGKPVDCVVKEVASGMNENRPKLNKILEDKSITTIVVEHRDRFTRFNYKLIESVLKAQGREIVVVDDSELNDDIVHDITEFMTSVCARLYGKRGAKNRAHRMVKEMEKP